jgi:prepilin peptidase CpaA
MIHLVFAYATVGFACALAAATDLRTRRIPNVLTGGLALAALVLALSAGLAHFAAALAVAVAVFAFGTLCFAVGVLGGGDVKLITGIALALGYPLALGFVLDTLVCGGLLALGYLVVRGRLADAAARMRGALFGGGRAAIGAGSGRLPYALAIGAGVVCSALATFALPALRIAP